jgi:two-component system cell cycle response regulator DivK
LGKVNIQLPGMDGLSATRLFKADPVTHDIKILAMTALAMNGDRERIEAAGCDGYIAKPIRYQEFIKLVDGMVGK